jgi:hypothetical protein
MLHDSSVKEKYSGRCSVHALQESLKASAPEHKHKIKVVSNKIGKAAKGAASASGKAAKAIARAGAGDASFVFDRRKPVSLPVRSCVHTCVLPL